MISKNRTLTAVLLACVPLLAACEDEAPTSPGLDLAIHSLLGGLDTGDAYVLTGADAGKVYLTGGPAGEEYVVIPFNGGNDAGATLDLQIAGDGVGVTASGPSFTRVPAEGGVPDGLRLGVPDRAEHVRFLERSHRETRRLLRAMPAGRAARASLYRAGAVRPAAVPRVGDLLELNAQYDDPCGNPIYRTGRVAAVSDRAIVVADTQNPDGGFTDADYAAMADEFDRFIHPTLVETFGEPADIDDNGRVIIFFTSAVNELTPPGSDSYVLGFFYARDLFPRQDAPGFQGCPGSNEAEMFYILVPDPSRVDDLPVFSRENVAKLAPSVIGHEYQHLINDSRRLFVNDAFDWEEGWLNEGLSHIAQELLFYEATGLMPGQNLDLEPLVVSEQRIYDTERYVLGNIANYATLLEDPEAGSLFDVDIAARGGSWSFLRYLADHEERDDGELFFALANSTLSGLDNLNSVLGGGALDRIRDWTISIYADDNVPGVQPRYTQPSWNMRMLLSRILGEFPLATVPLGAAAPEPLSLKGGGAAFLRVRVDAQRRATLTTTAGGAAPPATLRLSVIRVR